MTPFDRPHTSYSLSTIVNMSLSSTITEIFSVEYQHDLEMWVRWSIRSLKMVPIDRSFTTLYCSAIVTIALSCNIFEFINVQNIMTLKCRLRGHSKSLEMAPFNRSHTIYYSSSIVTGHILHRCRNKARYWSKTPIFHTMLYLTCTIPQDSFKFLPKILTQTVRVPQLLGGAEILPESFSLPGVQQCYR